MGNPPPPFLQKYGGFSKYWGESPIPLPRIDTEYTGNMLLVSTIRNTVNCFVSIAIVIQIHWII